MTNSPISLLTALTTRRTRYKLGLPNSTRPTKTEGEIPDTIQSKTATPNFPHFSMISSRMNAWL